jgi:hypothetical protein
MALSKDTNNNVYKRFAHVFLTALAGQARTSVIIAVYFVVALLLLSYVSAQVYGGMLRQEIVALKKERCELKENLNKLTGDCVSLSSRGRVSSYCENKLGMVEAAGETVEVLAVEDGAYERVEPVELTTKHRAIPAAYRYTLRRCSESPGQ